MAASSLSGGNPSTANASSIRFPSLSSGRRLAEGAKPQAARRLPAVVAVIVLVFFVREAKRIEEVAKQPAERVEHLDRSQPYVDLLEQFLILAIGRQLAGQHLRPLQLLPH